MFSILGCPEEEAKYIFHLINSNPFNCKLVQIIHVLVETVPTLAQGLTTHAPSQSIICN
jgi:hypothetical protein